MESYSFHKSGINLVASSDRGAKARAPYAIMVVAALGSIYVHSKHTPLLPVTYPGET